MSQELRKAVEAALGWSGIEDGWIPGTRFGRKPNTPLQSVPDYLPEQGVGASWECVDRLVEFGWMPSLDLLTSGEWQARFTAYPRKNGLARTGTTPAEAICKAFLRVLKEFPEKLP